MPEGSKTHMGGTMRLGTRTTLLTPQPCIARAIYGGVNEVDERHRHRYEVNPELVPQLEAAGLLFTGYAAGRTPRTSDAASAGRTPRAAAWRLSSLHRARTPSFSPRSSTRSSSPACSGRPRRFSAF